MAKLTTRERFILEKAFPPNGPCMFHPTLYARHRVIDVIRARLCVGASIRSLAADFERAASTIRLLRNVPTEQLAFLRRFRKPTCRKCWPFHEASEECRKEFVDGRAV